MWVVGAALVDIADSDALDVGLLQKMKHDTKALRTNADERDVDLVAWRNVTRAAEYSTRNNGKAEGGGGSLCEEFATRDGIWARIAKFERFFHGTYPEG